MDGLSATLAETCLNAQLGKSAAEDTKAKLSDFLHTDAGVRTLAGALYGLAGGALGAGAGYLLDRSRAQDEDGSAKTKAKKRRSRVLTGAGIGALAGGLGGAALAKKGPAPIGPGSVRDEIVATLGPRYNPDNVVHRAVVNRAAGLDDAHVPLGTHIRQALPFVGTDLPWWADAASFGAGAVPTYYWVNRGAETAGMRNFLRGVGIVDKGTPRRTATAVATIMGLPHEGSYREILGRDLLYDQLRSAGVRGLRPRTAEAVRANLNDAVYRDMLRMFGEQHGININTENAQETLRTFLPAWADDLESGRLRNANVRQSVVNTMRGSRHGDPVDFHSRVYGRNTKKKTPTTITGREAHALRSIGPAILAGILSNTAVRGANNAIMNWRLSRVSDDVRRRLLA